MTLIETVKTAIEVSEKFKDLALKQALAAVREQSIDLQGKLIEQKQELLDLRQENNKLQEAFKRKGQFKKGNKHLWEVKDGKKVDGPFCITCWERNREILSLVPAHNRIQVMCPICKNNMDPNRAPDHFD